MVKYKGLEMAVCRNGVIQCLSEWGYRESRSSEPMAFLRRSLLMVKVEENLDIWVS